MLLFHEIGQRICSRPPHVPVLRQFDQPIHDLIERLRRRHQGELAQRYFEFVTRTFLLLTGF